MAAVSIHSDFEAQENKVWPCFHCFPIYLPWSDGTGCHGLRFLNAEFYHSPLSALSRGSLVPLCFLPYGWCHLHILDYWYFSLQSWFQLVFHPVWHFTWCTLHISSISKVITYSLDVPLSQFGTSPLFHGTSPLFHRVTLGSVTCFVWKGPFLWSLPDHLQLRWLERPECP